MRIPTILLSLALFSAALCLPSPRAHAAAKKPEVIRESVPATAQAAEAKRHYVEGGGHFLAHDLEKAIESYRQALAIDPKFAEARFSLANALWDSGRTSEALREWRSTLKFDPGFIEAYLKLGNVYKSQGDYELAMETYEKALARRPDDPALLSATAALCYENGDLIRADELLTKASEIDPNSQDIQDQLGLIYLGRKFNKSAVARFKRAIELQPDRAEFYDHLGRANFTRAEDSRENAADLAEQLKKSPGNQKIKDKIKVSKNNQNIFLGRAVDAWLQSIRLDETSAEVRTSLAGAYKNLGKMDDAIAQYREASQLAPADALAHVRLADALREKREPIDAIYEYEEALKIDPGLYSVHFQMGLAYMDKKMVEEATAAFERFIAAAPAAEKAQRQKAQQYIRMINFVPER